MLVVSDHTPASEGGPLLMLSERSSVDIHALKRQGMTISEIARRTCRRRSNSGRFRRSKSERLRAV